MTFDLTTFKGDSFDESFTLLKYLETHKLTRVQIYLSSKCLKPPGNEAKGKLFRQNLNVKLEEEKKLKEVRDLKTEQDKEYEESLAADRKKKEELEDEVSKVAELEELRYIRGSMVPEEPPDNAQRVNVVVKHISHGTVKRFFHPSEHFSAVYNWIGSLELSPEHFSLCIKPGEVISPEDYVQNYHSRVLFMMELQKPLEEHEVNFKGSVDYYFSHSLDDTLPQLPEQIMVYDDFDQLELSTTDNDSDAQVLNKVRINIYCFMTNVQFICKSTMS